MFSIERASEKLQRLADAFFRFGREPFLASAEKTFLPSMIPASFRLIISRITILQNILFGHAGEPATTEWFHSPRASNRLYEEF